MSFKNLFGSIFQSPATSYYPTQESRVSGAVSYTSGKWKVKDKGGVACWAKGVRVAPETEGNLRVHLVDDPADQYETYPLNGGELGHKEGFIFDEIIETGTTINLSNVKILI